MHIGIIGGTGPAGRGLAVRLAAAGDEVTIGSRSSERAGEVAAQLRDSWADRRLALTGAANDDAAEAEVVVLATPWDAAVATVRGMDRQLSGRIVVCMANALIAVGRELQPLMSARGSVAALVAAALPDARVSAAFHHLPARELEDLAHPLEGDVLVCGDDAGAVEAAAELARRMPDLRPLEAGSLAMASPIESFTAVLVNLNRRYRTHSAIRVTGIPEEGK